MAHSANREAVTCFEETLVALEHLPETRETLEQAIDLRFDLRTSLLPLGEFERIFGYLREAESLCKSLDDQRRLGHQCVYMCHSLYIAGHRRKRSRSARVPRLLPNRLGIFRSR